MASPYELHNRQYRTVRQVTGFFWTAALCPELLSRSTLVWSTPRFTTGDYGLTCLVVAQFDILYYT